MGKEGGHRWEVSLGTKAIFDERIRHLQGVTEHKERQRVRRQYRNTIVHAYL